MAFCVLVSNSFHIRSEEPESLGPLDNCGQAASKQNKIITSTRMHLHSWIQTTVLFLSHISSQPSALQSFADWVH